MKLPRAARTAQCVAAMDGKATYPSGRATNSAKGASARIELTLSSKSLLEWDLFFWLDDRDRIENVVCVVVFGSLDGLNELESELVSPMIETLLDRIPTRDRGVAACALVVRAVYQLRFRDETLSRAITGTKCRTLIERPK